MRASVADYSDKPDGITDDEFVCVRCQKKSERPTVFGLTNQTVKDRNSDLRSISKMRVKRKRERRKKVI